MQHSQQHAWLFFALVLLLAVPFWIIGADDQRLLFNLPLSALMFLVIFGVALGLTYRDEGMTGVKSLLKRCFDYRIMPKRWYWIALGLMPLFALSTYIIMRLTNQPLPKPEIKWWLAPILFAIFFISGLGEEVGWASYAPKHLQSRWNALTSYLIIGMVWAVLHLIPWWQTKPNLAWITAQAIFTIAIRIIMGWIYQNTKQNLFALIVFHAMINVSVFMFPNNGSHYNPFIVCGLTLIVTLWVIVRYGKNLQKT